MQVHELKFNNLIFMANTQIHCMYAFHAGLVVSPESSLFTYEPHEDYYDFFLPWFTPSFFPQFASEELRQEATDLCDGDEFCLYDVMVTGQLEVGNLTKASSQRWLELVELSEQSE